MTEEKQIKDYLISNGYSFKATEYFSGCKFNFNNDQINTCGYTPNYMLGASMQIKKQVKKNILNKDMLPMLLNYTQTEGYYIYKEKPILSAWQYDIKGAYLMFLNQMIDEQLYNKLLKYKENGVNVNKIIGMALLGSRIDVSYKNGERDFAQCIINELRPVFFFLRYLTIESINLMLHDYFKEHRVARYIDSLIIANDFDMTIIIETFKMSIDKAVERLDSRSKKYLKLSLFDIINFSGNASTIVFHKQYIESLTYNRNKLTNCLELNFYRRSKDGKRLEKVQYKQHKVNSLTS